MSEQLVTPENVTTKDGKINLLDLNRQQMREFFKDLGECYNYGMILPLSELSAELIEMWRLSLSGLNAPYLGISLE